MGETTLPADAPAVETEAEDRLEALLADEPDTDEEPDEGNPDEEEGAPAEPQAEESTEEVEFEGKSYSVPKELKPALLRTEDYTRKTMELAAARKQVEDKQMFVEAREQVRAALVQDMAVLMQAESELQQFQNVDWVSLANTDPGQAFAAAQRQKRLEQIVGEKRQRIASIEQQAAAVKTQHDRKQWEIAVEGAKSALGKVTPEDDSAALKLVRELGFAESEMNKLADSRLLQIVFEAARWRALQASKPGVTKKAASAPPMKSVARSAPQAQADGRVAIARQQLKKTGSQDHAVTILENMFRKR